MCIIAHVHVPVTQSKYSLYILSILVRFFFISFNGSKFHLFRTIHYSNHIAASIAVLFELQSVYRFTGRSQWLSSLRRRSTAARLLRSWVRIPPRAWMFVCCECCVLSGRGLCDELITRPEESYRLWCVIVCDQETS